MPDVTRLRSAKSGKPAGFSERDGDRSKYNGVAGHATGQGAVFLTAIECLLQC